MTMPSSTSGNWRGKALPFERVESEMRFLDQDEVTALIGAIDPNYAAFVATAAYTGVRFGELTALRAPRLDLLRASLTVVEQLSEVNGNSRCARPRPRRRAARSPSPVAL